jgi:hypothetical protein
MEKAVGRNGMAPPITYEVDGTQYVAFMGGTGRPQTVVGPTNAKLDYPPMLYVFQLDGKAEMPAAQPPPQFGRGGAGRGPAPAAPPVNPPHAENK